MSLHQHQLGEGPFHYDQQVDKWHVDKGYLCKSGLLHKYILIINIGTQVPCGNVVLFYS